MEKMDLMSINAGEVIQYQGMPLLLPHPVQVLGNRKNFFKDGEDFYTGSGAAIPSEAGGWGLSTAAIPSKESPEK